MTATTANFDRPTPTDQVGSRDGKRLTVALPFQYQEKWVGGLYYVRNVVAALGLLPAEDRPSLVIIGHDLRGLKYLRTETGYPGLSAIEPSILSQSLGRIVTRFFPIAKPLDQRIDVVLMGSVPGLERRAVQWIPDFQEERLPQFFRSGEIHARRRLNSKALAKHRHVMVSSEDVRSDLELFYGKNQNRIHVIRFASFADLEPLNRNAADLRARYDLPSRFFICTNQIWRHKNHAVVLRALAKAVADDDKMPAIIFTGREHDYRLRDYPVSIKALAAELGLDAKARFLGFLPRADQLGLVAASIAVIQPSLCEGWSVAVEDAKALGKHVLASEIAVHREQLDRNADFFAPDDVSGLAGLLRRYRDRNPEMRPLDYERKRRDFAEDLLRMLEEVSGDNEKS
jgi:glycosyltransferase involved in cell wall biosynthesis